jgi:quercetin dioxygenase-like cupin family protein
MPEGYQLELLFEAPEARASLVTLAPGQFVPPHRHGSCSDFMFVVDGVLTVEFHEGQEDRAFERGQRCTVRPGVVHSTVNRADAECRFLLVQIGRYDFQRVAD